MNSKLLTCFSLFALVFLSCTNAAITYRNCKGPTPVGVINSLSVSECTASPCQVKQGHNYTITVNFTITESTDHAFADVHGVVAGVPVEFPLPQKNGCESGLVCPLKAQGTYVYKSTLPILKEYPAIGVVVEWALNDAKSGGNTIWCFETPIHVVSG